MQEPRTCDRCGGANLEPGVIGDAAFVADHQKFLTIGFYGKLHAYACLDCGAVSLAIDPDKLRGALKQRDT